MAEGLDVFVAAPRAGEHRLTLQVATIDGRAEQTVKFRVVRVPDGAEGAE